MMAHKMAGILLAGGLAILLLTQHLLAQTATSGEERLAEADRHYQEAVSLERSGQLKEATVAAETALEIQTAILGSEHPETAVSLNFVGELYRKHGEYEISKDYLERSLAIWKELRHPEGEAAVRNNLGALARNTGDLPSAKAYIERALEIWQEILEPEHPNIGAAHTNLGDTLLALGDLEGARDHLERGLALWEKVLDPWDMRIAISHNNLGTLHQAMGNFKAARTHYERSLEIRKAVLPPEHPMTAQSLNNLGTLFQMFGDVKTAKSYHLRAFKIRMKKLGRTHPDTLQSLNNLGVLLQDTGNFRSARYYLERVLKIREEKHGPAHPDTLTSLSNFCSLLLMLEDLKTAKEHCGRALTIGEEKFGTWHPFVAASLNKQGILLHAMDQLEAAKEHYKRSLQIGEQILGRRHRDTAGSMVNLASVLQDLGQFTAAKVYYERALEIQNELFGMAHPDTATTLENFSTLLQEMGDIDQAVETRTKCLEAQEALLSATLSIGSETEKTFFLQTLIGSSYGGVSLHVDSAPDDLRAARLALNTVLRRKGRALDATVEGLRLLRRNMGEEERALLDRLIGLREALAYTLLRPSNTLNPEQRRNRLQRLNREILTVSGELAVKSSRFQEQVTPVTLEAVQEKIPRSTVLVELYVYFPFDVKEKTWGKARYVAYVLRSNGTPRWVKLDNKDSIDAAVAAFQRAIAKRSNDVRLHARNLDALTMEKIRPLLGDARDLVISPDGVLNLVPFAALVGENGKYLIEEYGLSYVTSGRDLLHLGRASIGGKILLLGDVQFSGLFGPGGSRGGAERSSDMQRLRFGLLPNTEKEVRAIGRIFGVPKDRILTGEAATEGAVKGVHGPRILHLATHGFFLPDLPEPLQAPLSSESPPVARLSDPLVRSGLALSGFNRRQEATTANDGVLTALEVMGLDLWGTEVVALSACETGLGDVRNGQGVFGLRRALVLAGSETQVMSLWKVADEATQQLMVAWYGQLKQTVGRAEAMRRIQLAALRGEALPVTDTTLARGVLRVNEEPADPQVADTRHPYYWASFIVAGEPGPLPPR